MAYSSCLGINLKKSFEFISILNILSALACTPPEQFEKNQIIPDVLDKAPLYKVEVNI